MERSGNRRSPLNDNMPESNWDCLPLKSPRSKSGKAFAGFRQTSSILAIYLQRRLSWLRQAAEPSALFTLCSCRQRVKARPAWGQNIELNGICWHFQQVLINNWKTKTIRVQSKFIDLLLNSFSQSEYSFWSKKRTLRINVLGIHNHHIPDNDSQFTSSSTDVISSAFSEINPMKIIP